MKPIIRWTLRERKTFIIWWCIGITAFLALSLGFYPAVKNQAAQLNQALDQIPKAARAFVTDSSDILSPKGFLSARVFYLMLPMILSVLSINLGNSLISREENSGTIELLLSRPLSRSRFLFGKAVAGLFIILIVGTVSVIDIVLLSWLVGLDVSLLRVALATLLCILFVISIGSISFYMSAIGGKGRLASVGIAAFIAFGSYIVSSLTSIVDWLKWPDKFLPYHYYRPREVINGAYDWRWALLFVGLALFLGLLSWLAFRRRDIGA